MNDSIDRMLADWLCEGPERGPHEGPERALAAARRVGQRPGWTLPERWIPMELITARTRSQRPILAVVVLALLMVALIVAALVIGSQRHQTPSLYRNGAVVYAEAGDLFIADELGGTPRPLVAGPADDSNPVFSPQGDRVAFHRAASDGTKVMAVRPDGTDLTELAAAPGWDLHWSPDGQALLSSGMQSGDEWYQTVVIASDGSGSRTLRVGTGGHVISAAWRPGAQQILFRGTLAANENWDDARMYIANADGTNVRAMSIGSDFAWSPDGKRIAFASDGPGGGVRIADVDQNGTLTRSLVVEVGEYEQQGHGLQWSPDGARIAFRLAKGTQYDVGVVDSDGSGFRNILPQGSTFGEDDFLWSVGDVVLDPSGAVESRSEYRRFRHQTGNRAMEISRG